MQEIWKKTTISNNYEVSNLGNVRSLKRTETYLTKKINGDGFYNRKVNYKGKILSGTDNGKGYFFVYITEGGKKNKAYIHRLVALSFIDNPYNKECVNHIDFNPLNNNLNNLEWCTHLENMKHSINAGRFDRTKKWVDNLKKSNEKYKKKVIGTNMKNGYVIVLDYLNQCAEYGFRPGDVSNVCNKNRKYSKGYYFNFVKEN